VQDQKGGKPGNVPKGIGNEKASQPLGWTISEGELSLSLDPPGTCLSSSVTCDMSLGLL